MTLCSNVAYRLKLAFEAWVSEIEYTSNINLKFNISDSLFICFNYTKTLEVLYNVPQEQILYIHGNVTDNGPLIFGHGEKECNIINAVMAETGNVDDSEFRHDIIKFIMSLHKDVATILNSHKDIWNSMSSINDVHVWGHNLGDVDQPYFREIASHLTAQTSSEISWYIKESNREGSKSDEQMYLDASTEKLKRIKALKSLGFPHVDSKNLRYYDLNQELELYPKYQSIP